MTSLALGQLPLFAEKHSLVRLELCGLDDAWPTLIREHYLHRRRTMAQLAYAVIVHEWVDGYLVFTYPFGKGTRDGLPTMQVLELARLWLASNIRYTASGAIMASLKRVRTDWAVKYPQMPPIRAICSYSDEERHSGAIYRHAGFTDHGPRKGHAPGNRIAHPDLLHEKRLWMYRY